MRWKPSSSAECPNYLLVFSKHHAGSYTRTHPHAVTHLLQGALVLTQDTLWIGRLFPFNELDGACTSIVQQSQYIHPNIKFYPRPAGLSSQDHFDGRVLAKRLTSLERYWFWTEAPRAGRSWLEGASTRYQCCGFRWKINSHPGCLFAEIDEKLNNIWLRFSIGSVERSWGVANQNERENKEGPVPRLVCGFDSLVATSRCQETSASQSLYYSY